MSYERLSFSPRRSSFVSRPPSAPKVSLPCEIAYAPIIAANRASLDFTHPRIISDTFARLKETRCCSLLPLFPCCSTRSRRECDTDSLLPVTSPRRRRSSNNHEARNFQALEPSREWPRVTLLLSFVRFGKRNGNAIKSCNRASVAGRRYSFHGETVTYLQTSFALGDREFSLLEPEKRSARLKEMEFKTS